MPDRPSGKLPRRSYKEPNRIEVPMSAPYRIRKDDCTFEEFLEIVKDGQKADLLDGVIYMASPDNTDANDLTVWLSTILRAFADARGLGKIYILRVAYR